MPPAATPETFRGLNDNVTQQTDAVKEKPVLPPLKAPGDKQSIMGTVAEVVDAQRFEGIDHELYRDGDGGLFRMFDVEAEEVVTIQKFPKFDDAYKKYAEAVKANGGVVPELQINPPQTYRYGLQLRPPTNGGVPHGLKFVWDRDYRDPGKGILHGAITTERKLTDKEIDNFDLVDLNAVEALLEDQEVESETEDKYVFHRGSDPKTATTPVVLAADDRGKISGYGENEYAIPRSALVDIPGWVHEYAEQYYADLLGDDTDNFIPPNVNPEDIVNSADVWDDSDFVPKFWEDNEERLLTLRDSGAVTLCNALEVYGTFPRKMVVQKNVEFVEKFKCNINHLCQRLIIVIM